ncbi:hypothetical protein T310_8971, partial [Rasamsonia emersonii CBS 393.64]
VETGMRLPQSLSDWAVYLGRLQVRFESLSSRIEGSNTRWKKETRANLSLLHHISLLQSITSSSLENHAHLSPASQSLPSLRAYIIPLSPSLSTNAGCNSGVVRSPLPERCSLLGLVKNLPALDPSGSQK